MSEKTLAQVTNDALRPRIQDLAENHESALVRRRMKRALRNDRVMRMLRNEMLEELAEKNGFTSREEMLGEYNAQDVEKLLSDDDFDWGEFTKIMIQILEIFIKIFL